MQAHTGDSVDNPNPHPHPHPTLALTRTQWLRFDVVDPLKDKEREAQGGSVSGKNGTHDASVIGSVKLSLRDMHEQAPAILGNCHVLQVSNGKVPSCGR